MEDDEPLIEDMQTYQDAAYRYTDALDAFRESVKAGIQVSAEQVAARRDQVVEQSAAVATALATYEDAAKTLVNYLEEEQGRDGEHGPLVNLVETVFYENITVAANRLAEVERDVERLCQQHTLLEIDGLSPVRRRMEADEAYRDIIATHREPGDRLVDAHLTYWEELFALDT